MDLSRQQKGMLIGLACGLMAGLIVALGLSYFPHGDSVALVAFFAASISTISTVWIRGGRDLWIQLTLLWRTSLLIVAATVLFTGNALIERHHPDALWIASGLTAAAAVLLILYLLFSRAMDALWSPSSRRR
jgi:hypothetical protein